MNPGNLGQIRDKVSYLVNFNPGQTDQDFRGPAAYPNQRVHDAINEVYTEECALGKNVSRAWFKQTATMTWTADAATMPIPAPLRLKDIDLVNDNTSETPGPRVPFWNTAVDGSGMYRYDMSTWGWLPAPGEARTLLITYIAEPIELERDGDEPELIPYAYRDLLVWSAGIVLKTIADEDAPGAWVKRRDDLRVLFHKALAVGHPHHTPGPRILNTTSF